MNLTEVAGKRLVISALFPLVEQELSQVLFRMSLCGYQRWIMQ